MTEAIHRGGEPRPLGPDPILRGGKPRPPGPPQGAGGPLAEAEAVLAGHAPLPRDGDELVFEEPWQGRVFGMAVALHERGLYEWDEFRQTLIAQVAAAEARGGPFVYYEIWLRTFEDLLARKRLVTNTELDETTYQFEFGERDEVY